MTSFVRITAEGPQAGLERVQRRSNATSNNYFWGARSAATLLLAAVVAALLVVANRFFAGLNESSLFYGWALTCIITFAGLAVLSNPAYRAVVALHFARKSWAEARRRAKEDERTHNSVLRDARRIADLSRAMNGLAVENVRRYD